MIMRRPFSLAAFAVLVIQPAGAESGAFGAWTVNAETSSRDGRTMVTAMAYASAASQNDPAYVAVRCLGGRTEVLIGTAGGFGVSRTTLEVETKAEGRAAETSRWDVSTNGKAVFRPDGVEAFLKALPDAGSLTVRIRDRTGAELSNVFKLAGIAAVRAEVAKACGWAP